MLDMNEYRILIKSVYVYIFPLNAILVEFPRDLARPKHIDLYSLSSTYHLHTHTDIQIECAVIQVHMHNYSKYFLQFVFFFSFK